MTDTVLNFSTNQSASNLLLSQSDTQTLIDASVLASVPTFSNATNYVAGDKVYYLGIYYVAPVNINLGGGTPLANTTWRQIPTWGSYTTTASSAGTFTMDLYSAEIQRITGTTTHTYTLPVASTLPALGKPFYFINDSTGTVTVNSSGGNLVATILAGQRYFINNILLSGTTAASWTVSSGYETTTTIGALISGSTAKTTLVDADLIPLDDSAASNILKNITWQNLKASIFSYTTTATAAGTTTLTAASTLYQFFTGVTTQTLTLPVTSTLYTGLRYKVVNNSTGLVTVQSSGANSILVLAASTSAEFICILTSGTTAASWQAIYNGTVITSGKKLSATASVTIGGTDGKTASFSNNLTFAGTDGKTVTFNNSITFSGTDSTTMTFPSTSASIARIDAAQSFSGTQTFNNYIQLSEAGGILMDQTLSADGTFSIAIGEVGTLGETLAFGTLIYYKSADSRWWKCDSDSESTSGPVKLGMVCVAGNAGDDCQIMLKGKIRADSLFPTFTVGAPVHVGATAGEVVVAEPTSGFIRVIGYGNTADSLYFNPSNEYYERGTFNGGISFGGGTTGITYTARSCYYEKRKVNVSIRGYILLSSKGSSTGDALITSLPFTTNSSAGNYGCLSQVQTTIVNSGNPSGYINLGATTVNLYQTTLAGTGTTQKDTDFNNTSSIIFSLNYIT